MEVEPGHNLKINRWISLAMAAVVLALLWLLVQQLVSRFHCQQASVHLSANDLDQARVDLEKARGWLGTLSSSNDSKRIDLIEGDLHISQAETARTVTTFLEEMEQAEELFRAVVARDPLDIDGFTGLARATAALEKVYPFVHKQPFPNGALPVFQQLLALMPTNIYTHTLLTRYYLSRNMTKELNHIIGQSISISPPLYFQLKRQTFYSMAMNEMLKASLQSAVEKGIYLKSALKALADLALQEEDYSAAISYFLQTRPISPYQDNSGYYLQLGGLYLRAEQFAEAAESFAIALKTTGRDGRLGEIWRKYSSLKLFREFLSFCKSIKTEKSSDFLEIVQAKCLMRMGRQELALSHLIRIDSKKYLAESMYLQGKIAESQKDWDTMELRSQRAAVLGPTNSSYHLLFSRALKNQHKWPQAEQAAGDAITSSAKPNPWLYNHRAWIRWSRHDYQGAQQDWQSAIVISPQTAWFYESMARVFEQGGSIKEAIRYLQKAITLQPDEPRFRQKYDMLQKKLTP